MRSNATRLAALVVGGLASLGAAARDYPPATPRATFPPTQKVVHDKAVQDTNLVVNGSFETNGGNATNALTGWTVVDQAGGSGTWFALSALAGPLSLTAVPAPPAGAFAAVTDQNSAGSHVLYQDVTIPANGATLSFQLYIGNSLNGFVIPSPQTLDIAVNNQQFRADLISTTADPFDVGSGVLQNLYQTLPGDPPVSGYSLVTRLIAGTGQPRVVRLRFAEADNQTYFQAGIDDVVLVSGGGTPLPGVLVSVAPTRITASQQVTISWTATNSTSCVVSGGAPGSTFNVSQTPGGGTATTNVTISEGERNDVFFVTCTGPGGTTKASTALAVGASAPPPAQPVAVQSAGLGGQPANARASNISLSDGGKFVAFESLATNLVAGDTNGLLDVFVRDTTTGGLRRVVDNGGTQLNAVSGEPRITRDGRVVAFTRGTGQAVPANATAKSITGGQVCLYDLNGNVLTCVSKSPGGAPGNGDSGKPSISGDGKVTVFESEATNLGATPDPNGGITDVFSYDRDTDTSTILSNTSAGAPSTANSTGPSVSCNGKNFVFESLAPLAPGATQAGVRNIVAISLVGGGKKLVTIGTGGAASNGDSRAPRITDDGRFVVFESSASNLVSGDTNGASDIFQADLLTGTIKRLSVSATGTQANGASRAPGTTCDGSYVTFESDASNLVAGDGNGATDTFVLNTASGTVALASKTSSGGATDGSSTNGQISPDGSVVGFDSSANNLGSTSGGSVFSGQNPFSVQNYTGVWYDPAQSGHGLFLESQPNGTLLAWWFTFDPSGAQAWFGGTGPQNGNTATVNVVRTLGARFLPNFNPADAKNTPIGTLTLSFTSCDVGRVDFALDNTFGTGFMNLKRLTGPVGTNCTPGQPTSQEGQKRQLASLDTVGPPTLYPQAGMPKALEPTQGPIAGLTGVWYNPAQSGQGLFFENLGNGGVLAWWFTFGPDGGQAWFGGGGTITGPKTATFNFVKTQGGKWIPNFNPANVSNAAFGPVTLTMTDCGNASLSYAFQQGFGSGVFAIVPISRPVGTVCDD